MREKQNTYLFTAGILVFAFLFMPLTKFAQTGEVFSIQDFVLFIRTTGYKYYVGGGLTVFLAAFIFAAVTVYRNRVWQRRLIRVSLILNTLLFAFIVFKFVYWITGPRISLEKPTLQFGIAFPVLVEVMLIGALQKLNQLDE